MNYEKQVGKINKFKEMVMIKHMKNTESPSVLHKSISKTKVAQVTVH